MNRTTLLLALLAAAGCTQSSAKPIPIQTATIQRRDIIVDAEATGIIEPINVIEVKSKTASGQVVTMPVEIGTHVQPGDLIVQIDTTDLQTNFRQAQADLAAARSNFDVSKAQLDRQTKLFQDRVITQPELETAQMAFANANATLQRNLAAVDLVAQKLKDAKVLATVEGTIITKPVSVGQVIQAGGQSVSGGTIIVTMADLTKVRSRALVNETDIGQVQPGQYAVVTVDAFPDRPFNGLVEKIEPNATVQQNVTMFPVWISLDNREGLLKPGMNGEVAIRTDERRDVVAVPNDAIRSLRELAQAATVLGLNPDSLRTSMRGMGGGNGGRNGGGQSSGRGVQVQINRGELDLPLQGDQGGGRQSGRRGGVQQMQVTDADCAKIDDAMKKKPAIARKIDDLRTRQRAGGADRQAMMAEMQKLYQELGVDMRMAGACRNRSAGGVGGRQFAGGGPRAQGGGGQGGRDRSARRSGLVFVQRTTGWEAKNIRLGVANYDFTEVLDDGVKEGDKVALLSAAMMQANRQAQMDRQKANAGPLGGQPGGGPGGGPGRGGGRGQ